MTGAQSMSFAAPLFLLALLVVPAAVALYMRSQSRPPPRGGSLRVAGPHELGRAQRRQAGAAMRRWSSTPLAVAAGALALARPETTVAVPEERASVILVTDQSGSMDATDVEPSRLRAAQAAARDFLEGVPEELRVGAVAFNHAVRAIQSPTTDRQEVREVIDHLRSSGGTATGEGLSTALGLLERQAARDRRRAPAAIVLLSDGESTHGRDPMDAARIAARLKIPVYTVALGTPDGTIRARVRGGGTVVRRVPPGPRHARADREHHPRAGLRGGGRRRARHRLRAARLPGGHAPREARDQRRVRRRSDRSSWPAAACSRVRWFARLP